MTEAARRASSRPTGREDKSLCLPCDSVVLPCLVSFNTIVLLSCA